MPRSALAGRWDYEFPGALLGGGSVASLLGLFLQILAGVLCFLLSPPDCVAAFSSSPVFRVIYCAETRGYLHPCPT